MSNDRRWMYYRLYKGRILNEFDEGVEKFLDFVYAHPEFLDGDKIRCPSHDCQGLNWKSRRDVKASLLRHGFRSNYTRWTQHGEPYISHERVQKVNMVDETNDFERDNLVDMAIDAIHQEFETQLRHEEEPNSQAKEFFKLLKDAEKPLWNGCSKHTKLSAVTRFLQLKSDHRLSNKGFDALLQLIKEILPEDASLPDSYYEVNTMMKKVDLQYEEIHACRNDCVLFWEENHLLTVCPVCNNSRYKNEAEQDKKYKLIPWKILRYFLITPRLQRLYMSSKTTEHMRWHSDSRVVVSGEMRHPADGEA